MQDPGSTQTLRAHHVRIMPCWHECLSPCKLFLTDALCSLRLEALNSEKRSHCRCNFRGRPRNAHSTIAALARCDATAFWQLGSSVIMPETEPTLLFCPTDAQKVVHSSYKASHMVHYFHVTQPANSLLNLKLEQRFRNVPDASDFKSCRWEWTHYWHRFGDKLLLPLK